MEIKKPKLEGVSLEGDKNNCTVIALAQTTGLPYDFCYQFAKLCGRKDKKGFKSEVLLSAFNKKHGSTFRKVKRTTITAEKFCRLNPQGRFFVRKSGHAFSIVDGVVYDNAKAVTPKTRIRTAWKLCDLKNVEVLIS